MPTKKRATRQRAAAPVDRTAVSNLLYQYVMLTPEEQREFNRKLRVLRDNTAMLSDLAERWRASAATTNGQ